MVTSQFPLKATLLVGNIKLYTLLGTAVAAEELLPIFAHQRYTFDHALPNKGRSGVIDGSHWAADKSEMALSLNASL